MFHRSVFDLRFVVTWDLLWETRRPGRCLRFVVISLCVGDGDGVVVQKCCFRCIFLLQTWRK